MEPDFTAPGFFPLLTELLRWRRDVRHFRTDEIPEAELLDLLRLAQLAPSVGLSQPWRFMRVRSAAARALVRENFRRCNEAALSGYQGEDAALYARLKLAGLDQAPVQLAVFCDGASPTGRGLGRRTMPEMLEYSVVTAVHTLWLAARAKGIGMGWVSILDPEEIAKHLQVPPGWRLIAYLCLGRPAETHIVPELERVGWEHRQTLEELLVER
ncbi:MAG TPA: 5,6-dimethylbenzimidazole synthase [Acidocella sp.]|jgi:5,6-dimethylbenzimidazole synthase|uniref:5,6-dimethylbenzimidazole synthase n=1 Tax=Acidocella sp. TaxID=50710 RepID=UPI002C4173B5|nr:5,6-dimethylbenzimidazole synthase [Acidocella sp.]HVE22784.1 5,6-dimethylbenzimidazole synthase [Acidocella sp.]